MYVRYFNYWLPIDYFNYWSRPESLP